MKKLFSLFTALALCTGLLAGCGGASSGGAGALQRYQTVFYDVFDTATTVTAYCASQQEFDTQMEALHADLQAYHKLYDIYNEYEGLTNLKTVNDTAAAGPVQVDARIMDMLVQAKEMYTLTQGQTNIAMGSMLKLWHNSRAAMDENQIGTPPAQAELEAAAQHGSMEDLILDPEAGTVSFADPALQLDVGSCGKGYACEMAARAAEARGLTSALISVGGSLRAIGEKPGGAAWTGGVEVPWKDSKLAQTTAFLSAVNLTDGTAMVTSGDYHRYFVDSDGVRYAHLIDPDTLQPARYCSSVTVLAPDSGLADCLSTGLFCMPVDEGLALVNGMEGIEAYWCLPDETTVQSDGWAAREMQ